MPLKIQIYSVVSSFFFGFFFSFLFNFVYNRVKLKNRYLWFLFNILFVCLNTFLYYMILEKVNNGILHPYCILSVIVGFVSFEFLYCHIDKKRHL